MSVAPNFIRTRGEVDLFYRDWGAGTPVVFLASWSLSSDSWAYQMAPLAEAGLRCVAFDRRGHGRSSDPGRGYDFDTLADDLADLLGALDLNGVTLVTFSAGAGEAVRYLTRHGARRVARLAMIAPTTPLLVRRPDNPDGIDPACLESLRRDQILRDWPQWLAENARPFAGPDASEAMLDWLRAMALQASLQGLAAFHCELSNADFRDELPRLDLPVLVIQGERDTTCPVDLTGRRTAALIPGSRLEVYEGAPHGVIVSHAARLARDLVEFVRDG